MSEIDRFYPWIEQTGNGGMAAEMVKSPDGGYVGWDDYAKLLREYVYLQGQKQHYMDEAAKWLDTAAKNWQAYQTQSDLIAELQKESALLAIVLPWVRKARRIDFNIAMAIKRYDDSIHVGGGDEAPRYQLTDAGRTEADRMRAAMNGKLGGKAKAGEP